MKIKWIIDIGIIWLIIFKYVFEKILKELRFKLEKFNCLIGVNGELLKELGKVIFEI